MATTAKKLSKEEIEKCRVLTPEFRVAYPHLFAPSAMPGTTNAPKYSVTMLFDKTTDLAVLKKAITQAKINRFGAKENWPEDIKSPVTNGDLPKFKDKEGYAGSWVVRASSEQDKKPAVVDQLGKEVLEASKVYPGCYADAQVYVYVWEFPKNSGNFGVGIILDGVRKRKDGKPFGNRKSASEMFAPLEGVEEDEVSEDEIDF